MIEATEFFFRRMSSLNGHIYHTIGFGRLQVLFGGIEAPSRLDGEQWAITRANAFESVRGDRIRSNSFH